MPSGKSSQKINKGDQKKKRGLHRKGNIKSIDSKGFGGKGNRGEKRWSWVISRQGRSSVETGT